MNKEFVIYESVGFDNQIITLDGQEISKTNEDVYGSKTLSHVEDTVLKIARILRYNVRYVEPNYE